MKTETQIEEIKLRVQKARAAAFAASHSDYPSDRESAMAELTAALDAAIAAAPAAPEPDAFDLQSWVEENKPQEASASRYLSPTAQYEFHKKVWEAQGRPEIAGEPAPAAIAATITAAN